MQIIDNFDLQGPIDSRLFVGLGSNRNDIEYKYTGLRIWDFNDNSAFVWNGATWAPETNNISGIGTTNYISKFVGIGNVIQNSIIFDNGTNVGIGTTNFISPNNKDLVVNGSTLITGNFYGKGDEILNLNANNITTGELGIDKLSFTVGEGRILYSGPGQVSWNNNIQIGVTPSSSSQTSTLYFKNYSETSIYSESETSPSNYSILNIKVGSKVSKILPTYFSGTIPTLDLSSTNILLPNDFSGSGVYNVNENQSNDYGSVEIDKAVLSLGIIYNSEDVYDSPESSLLTTDKFTTNSDFLIGTKGTSDVPDVISLTTSSVIYDNNIKNELHGNWDFYYGSEEIFPYYYRVGSFVRVIGKVKSSSWKVTNTFSGFPPKEDDLKVIFTLPPEYSPNYKTSKICYVKYEVTQNPNFGTSTVTQYEGVGIIQIDLNGDVLLLRVFDYDDQRTGGPTATIDILELELDLKFSLFGVYTVNSSLP